MFKDIITKLLFIFLITCILIVNQIQKKGKHFFKIKIIHSLEKKLNHEIVNLFNYKPINEFNFLCMPQNKWKESPYIQVETKQIKIKSKAINTEYK